MRAVAPDHGERPLAELVSLRQRVAVVTGGARGIGLAIGRRLVEAGALVVLADADAAGAEAAAADLGAAAAGLQVDVADERSVVQLADEAVERYGRLDVWVSNAGIYPVDPVLDMTGAQWDRVLAVDLRGVFLGAREAAKRMIAAGRGGVIVNVASTAAYRAGGDGASHYVAAKHGVLGLTKSLAVELGPHGIRVLAVAPGVTRTPGLDEAGAALEAAGFRLEGLGSDLPLGRIGVPDDVARAVLFCACDLSALMTGSVLAVDAGHLAT